ncbi:DUF4870 domain-containing protein [Peribacillus acanthi]|uniref:DUF4870 domain-containing protein n=1 Tax=Peribacillus acanthi TaxID=2171554 RepID=UPI000D3E2E46|nr:DUF4870 domain-containing protein [Peribacillus acanthi]
METNKVLASLNYFSVFFAPFLLPIIVYFVSDDAFVKNHAKSAFLSHIIPLVFIPLAIVAGFADFTIGSGFPILMMISLVLSGLASFVIFIWNIVRGIKILVNN